jgi:phage tail-like protein
MVAERRDPYLGFKFQVEIDDRDIGTSQRIGGFTEVTGLQVEIETHDYREGGVNDYMHKLAGPARYPSNLIFKHGLMDSDVLWKWQQELLQGRVERTNGAVVLLDSAGQVKWQWHFKHAYPVRWSGPELRAGTAEVAVETLELAHRGLEVEAG